ncbi:Selenium-binding protein 1 [Armadillidium nasatum]|uniref:Selenium-binding protein 1 n=1 Tax=Armadillidium nasatum TaxID=96803 RepID=A0A5N5SSU3_9CRUS|nr:Selenium-binding protein 1 [Armadillidium nasatum]
MPVGMVKDLLLHLTLLPLKNKGPWTDMDSDFGYDYWYQPTHDVLISSEWGSPKAFSKGFNPQDVANGLYGTHLNVYSWRDRTLKQRIELGPEGVMPLEIRFLHDPLATEGYVGSALYANVFRFYRKQDGTWDAHKVISVPPKKVEGWAMEDMPGVITDMLISLDDKYLYFSNWVHGDIRQYDITDRVNPRLVGQIFLGGSVVSDGPIKVLEDKELRKTQARIR